MSYFDDASLVMIPSGYKDGKVYSVKPTDGSGDLTFSRGSDIEATRVGPNGYIEKAKVNLLLQSNQFDTTWTNSNSTETGGQADKDGGTTAWKIDKSAASGYIRQAISQSGVQTLSVYAKKGTLNWIRIIADGGTSTPSTWFDLENGVVGAADFFTIDSNIEAAGNGYYRCSISFEAGTIAGVRIYPANANNDVSGTSGNIYIQDAQLNYGLVAQDYVETTTAAVVSGITNDMPRLNYDPANPTCPSLLLEGSRQNLFSYSEYINGLTFIQATATDNAETSPEGVVNAARVYDNAVNAQHRVGDNAIPVTSGTTYTFSVFAKKGTLRYCYLISTVNGTERWFFDLQEGTAITSGGTIEDYGNGWYRLSIQVTASSTGNEVFGFNLTNSSSNNTYVGTGTDYHIIYGFQCEAGSYPTSYIPTYGSSATRNKDECWLLNSGIMPTNYPFTLFVEAPIQTGKDEDFISFGRSDVSDSYKSIQFQDSSNKVQVQNRIAGTNIILTSSSTYTTGILKIAYKLTATEVKVFVNGIEEASSTSVPAFDSVDDLLLGQLRIISDTERRSTIKQALVFPTALSDADCITLTSL